MTSRFYGPDLTHVHHHGFGDFAREAAPGLLQLLRDEGVGEGRVVDLGCGTGIWAASLVAAGFRVLGIDRSLPMIATARREAPGATFLAGSFLTTELPPCDAVTAIGEVLCYRTRSENAETAPAAVLRRMGEALRPGGVLLFDVVVPAEDPSTAPRRARSEANGWRVIAHVEEDRERGLLLRRIVTHRRVSGRWRRSEELHQQRLLPAAVWSGALRQAGFRVRTLRGFGSRAFAPGRVGFLARRP
jgi:SAM-dependent methyltransferase